MSDLRVALIAEGPTDALVIQAALRAILNRPFVLTLQQPEPTKPGMGTGWGGVLKWCYQFRQSGAPSVSADPTLADFDLIVIHVDADVSLKAYTDYPPEVQSMASDMHAAALPCARPCPPPAPTVTALRAVLLSWLGAHLQGKKEVICIPCMSSEAWLVAAMFAPPHALQNDIECRVDLETKLANLPKAQRIRKSTADFRRVEGLISENWNRVRQMCTGALTFEVETLQAL